MNDLLYKVLDREVWRQSEADGVFSGSGIDLRDGFIHLSAAEQVIETVALHFAGQKDLVLVSIDPAELGSSLCWEPSRGGVEFPHVYGQIPMAAVTRTDPLPMDDVGVHQFPEGFPF